MARFLSQGASASQTPRIQESLRGGTPPKRTDMHYFHSLQWAVEDAAGHYGPNRTGWRRGAQPHQAEAARSIPAESIPDSGGLGHCVESQAEDCYDAFRILNPGDHAAVSSRASEAAQWARKSAWFAVLISIRFYKIFLSPLLFSSCRYYPTCSEYAYQAIEKWGVRNGTRLALRRLARCRPLGGGGIDLVP